MNNTNEVINVLISAVGCTTSISVIKALKLSKNCSYTIVGTDVLDKKEVAGSIFCNKYYVVPPIDNKDYISKLLTVCKDEKINVLIPILDHDVETISKNKREFEDCGIKVCTSDYETVLNCNDKYRTYDFLKSKNIKVPRVLLKDEILTRKSDLSYPLFVKPKNGISSIDCYKVNNESELTAFLYKIKNPIIQEYIEGQHCVIDVVNDLNGKNLLAIPRLEFGSKAGVGVKAEIVNDKSLIKYGKMISEVLNIKGVANIEVFKKNNEIKFIEINPRFSAGVILSVISGVNVPEIVINLFMNKSMDVKMFKWQEGYYMTRYWQEAYFNGNKKLETINYFK